MSNATSGQNIGFIPEQAPSIADKDYRLAVMILEETYQSIEDDNGQIVYADYWNLAYAYTLCEQSREEITFFLKKCKRMHPKNFTQLFNTSPGNVKQWEDYLGTEVLAKIRPDKSDKETFTPDEITPEIYCTSKYTDLQCQLARVWQADQHHRGGFGDITDQQRELDKSNQVLIDELFSEHKTYLGKDMVGQELSHVMWAVIQHSNLGMMKRYLPVIQEANRSDQLPGSGTLKLLVDRICTIEHGVQLFGSQAGVPLASEEQMKTLYLEYNLDTETRRLLETKKKAKTSRQEKSKPKRRSKTRSF